MNINNIIKQGLTGEEVGKLFLDDYTDYHFRLGEETKRHKNKEISLKEALNIKGLLSEAEKQVLFDSLKKNRDIKSYNNYMAILRYLDSAAIKMAYFQELVYSGCYRLAYLLATKTTEENEWFNLEESLKKIEEDYYFYLTMKTSIILIEEVTGNKNIFNSLNYEPYKIAMGEETLNFELGKFYNNRKSSEKYRVYLETQAAAGNRKSYKGIKIPEEIIDKAREEIKDLSFFSKGEYDLHHILARGFNDEQ